MVRSTLQRRLQRRRARRSWVGERLSRLGAIISTSLSGQQLIETITIVSFVTDDSGRCALSNHESKELLDEMALGGIGRGAASRYRQPLSVDQDHDLDAFANPSATDAIAPALGFGKSAIDETFVEAEPPSLFHTATSGSHQGLENTGIDPLEKPAVNRALRTKTRRQILPFRSFIEHPENARNHLSLIGGQSPSLQTAFRIRYSVPKANPTPLR